MSENISKIKIASRLSENKGIALITVLLIVIILEVLAIVALDESGYNVINAGAAKTTEYAFNISDAAVKVLLPYAINGGIVGTSPNSISFNPLDGSSVTVGDYYYTTNSSSSFAASANYITLGGGNLLSSGLSQAITGVAGPQVGVEYQVTGCWYYVYNSMTYYYYSGFLNAISRESSSSKIVEIGASFKYGTFTSQPPNCISPVPLGQSQNTILPESPSTPDYIVTSWYRTAR